MKQLYFPFDYSAVQITYYLKNHHLYQKIKNLESFIKHFQNSKLSVLKRRMSFMLVINTHTHTHTAVVPDAFPSCFYSKQRWPNSPCSHTGTVHRDTATKGRIGHTWKSTIPEIKSDKELNALTGVLFSYLQQHNCHVFSPGPNSKPFFHDLTTATEKWCMLHYAI